MNQKILITGLALGAALVLAGCGGGGSKTVAPPTPTGPHEVEPNDYTPQSLGTLGTSDIVLNATASGHVATGAYDVDLYSATLAATGALYVNVDWASGGDLELSLSNASGTFVRRVRAGGTEDRCQLGGLPAGTYTIRIDSFLSTATAYTLTVGKR